MKHGYNKAWVTFCGKKSPWDGTTMNTLPPKIMNITNCKLSREAGTTEDYTVSLRLFILLLRSWTPARTNDCSPLSRASIIFWVFLMGSNLSMVTDLLFKYLSKQEVNFLPYFVQNDCWKHQKLVYFVMKDFNKAPSSKIENEIIESKYTYNDFWRCFWNHR